MDRERQGSQFDRNHRDLVPAIAHDGQAHVHQPQHPEPTEGGGRRLLVLAAVAGRVSEAAGQLL